MLQNIFSYILTLILLITCHSQDINESSHSDYIASDDSSFSNVLTDSVNSVYDISLQDLKQIYINYHSIKLKGKKIGEFFGEPYIDSCKLKIKNNCNNLHYSYYQINDSSYMYYSSKNQNESQYRFIVYYSSRFTYIMPYLINNSDGYTRVDSSLGIIVRDNHKNFQCYVSFYAFRNSPYVPIIKSVMLLDSFLYPQFLISCPKPLNISKLIIGKVIYAKKCSWQSINEIDSTQSRIFTISDNTRLSEIQLYFENAKFQSLNRKPIVNPSLSYMYLWIWRGENNYTSASN